MELCGVCGAELVQLPLQLGQVLHRLGEGGGCVRACVRGRVRARARAWVRACVRACVRGYRTVVV